ncbi:factor associated with metabolism and energy isoform X2 [Neopsephotus bourkii]|uniref:factor associated with metabolism and energy isoform X2 n=1 Tax=Neopsephotus bourkii TaxID=309878 RepID=UPI002AA56E1A|nr:factor associated with metabolism and energy isoform X2 [Neopsephotus bourkii]
MGLNSSKAHLKVTKVEPMRTGEDLPVLTIPYWHPSMPGQPSLHPLAAEKWGNPTIHKELPPLRETWYGRASAGPLSFSTVPEKGETSIIKQHPPRRPQTLEKKGQSLRHLPGRRQHLHKLQMLDLTRRRQEAELKRNLHRETNVNKQNMKEFSQKKVLDSLQRGISTESRDLFPDEHNQHFHGDDHGNTWDGGLSRRHDEGWKMKELQMRDLFWDTSSTGSEEWEREEKIYHKHTLVRTKTERVSLFDDFFDRDF